MIALTIGRDFAKTEIVDNCCTIDLTEVDSKNALGLKNEFYISFRKGFVPKVPSCPSTKPSKNLPPIS